MLQHALSSHSLLGFTLYQVLDEGFGVLTHRFRVGNGG